MIACFILLHSGGEEWIGIWVEVDPKHRFISA